VTGTDSSLSSGFTSSFSSAWDGKKFTSQKNPGIHGASSVSLDGISCGTAIHCVAVGASSLHSGSTLVENYSQ
jgi:hypothetical protein